MTDEQKQAFVDYALKEAPKEAAAFLVKDGNRTKLEFAANLHPRPEYMVQVDSEWWSRGDVLSFVHSHVGTLSVFSKVDRVMCEESRLPWHLYSLLDQKWAFQQPDGFQMPLEGREFVWGVFDCYALVRDYYHQRLKIELPNFEREERFWSKGQNLFAQHLKESGFSRLHHLEKHCVVVMQIKSSVPNHLGVYIGNNLILHHSMKRLSCLSVFGGLWMASLVMLLKHKDVS